MGLGDFFGGGADAPDPIDPLQLGRQTSQLQKQFLGSRQDLRGEFDEQMIGGALQQAGRAQTGLSGLGRDVIGDMNQQRNLLSSNSIEQLRQQSPGFAGSERLQAMLQQQAESQLARGGMLSGEQMRDVDQMTQGAVASRGRGAGAFGVVQMAMNRQGAIQANEDRARQFAQQTQQGGLAMSNPLQRIFAQESASGGTFMDRLRNVQGFGQQNTVNFDPINANVSNIAQFNNQMQQQQAEASASGFGDILGGVLGGGLKIAGAGGFGNPFGIPGLTS